jgi:histidine triad (HIT) family protein
MAKCVFCDIIAGSVKAAIVYDDEATLGFLDHAPLLPGHVLVVPKAHIATLDVLPDELVSPYFGAVQQISRAVQKGMRSEGSFVAANIRISQSVPHLHFHVVPRNKGDGLFGRNFMWIRKPYPSEAAMAEAQNAIRAALRD